MATYAQYVIWAGIRKEEYLEYEPISELLEKARASGGVEKEDLKFEEIYMHGESIGIGVVIREMSWSSSIEEDNFFDLGICKRVERMEEKIREIFKKEGIPISVGIYHHIDLGG